MIRRILLAALVSFLPFVFRAQPRLFRHPIYSKQDELLRAGLPK